MVWVLVHLLDEWAKEWEKLKAQKLGRMMGLE